MLHLLACHVYAKFEIKTLDMFFVCVETQFQVGRGFLFVTSGMNSCFAHNLKNFWIYLRFNV